MDDQDPTTKGPPQPPAPPEKPPGPTTEELLKMGETDAGRKAIFRQFGVREQDRVLDQWGEVGGPGDDPEARSAHKALEQSFGGPAGMAAAASDLAEASAIFDTEGQWESELAIRTRVDEVEGIREIVAEYREALASPEKARLLLEEIYSDGSHPYFSSNNATPEMKRGIERLWKAAHGEPTDIPRRARVTDGEVR